MRQILPVLIFAALAAGCASVYHKPPTPRPGGGYPSVMFFADAKKPLYLAFSDDHGIPYNPVFVSAREHWDFAMIIRPDAHGARLQIDNRSPATIPISLSGVGSSDLDSRIKSKTTISLPMKDPRELVGVFVRVYDEAAIVTHGKLGGTHYRR